MSYQALLTRMLNENFLFSALLELTFACNLDCFFCYNRRTASGTPLSTEEYDRLLHELKEMGTWMLTFSGGEPLLRPDFFTLGRVARDLSFAVRIKTNGTLLRRPVAERLKAEVDPFMIEVSLHGARAATHDHQTRSAGSFGTLMSNLRVMGELGLRVQLNAMLTAWNEDEMEEMIDLADRLGLGVQIDPMISPRDDGDRGPLQISPSATALGRLQGIRGRAVATAPPPPAVTGRDPDGTTRPVLERCKYCGAGALGVAVDPWGNVYPCAQWRTPAGNLRQQSIRQIWEESEVLKGVRRTLEEMMTGNRSPERSSDTGYFCPALALRLQTEP